ncbi:rhomboid protein 1 [Pyrus ussuriensis x Pyrus communis]|uniref:Rhomboid protein 1 n=1 Tax=Pyrus ussuriensis x Pyrus communis TaxID=2448454 RepID=A0A5N5G7U3_9ROSA|nr:rhomboid protein 1 [Pyrus ussuriensis x Pyrus communis]
MQRLLSLKLASSNLPRNLPTSATSTATTSPIFHSQCHKTFSLAKPPITQNQNHFFSSFPALPLRHHPHPWRSQHTLAQKIHGFLSNSSVRKQSFLGFSNTLLRASSKSLSDCRVGFLRAQFPKRSFKFNQNFTSHRSPWRSWFGRLSNNEVVLGLIVANVAVFLLWRIADRSFMMNNFTISLHNFASGRLHTLITSAFSHIDAGHIFSNMIGLYFFGMNIGRVFGPEFLLKLYLAGAVGGSVFFLVHKAFLAASSQGQKPWNTEAAKIPGLGASGAVNAIMLLDIFLFPKATLYLEFIIPVPAILLGIFLIGNDVLRIIEGDRHISGAAHLGGAAVAAIAWARLRKGRF